MDVAEMYRARIVDVATETLIIEVTGESSKIEALTEVLNPFGILEMTRTGQIAMTRGAVVPRNGRAKVSMNGQH